MSSEDYRVRTSRNEKGSLINEEMTKISTSESIWSDGIVKGKLAPNLTFNYEVVGYTCDSISLDIFTFQIILSKEWSVR
jgi:hypothetical protein